MNATRVKAVAAIASLCLLAFVAGAYGHAKNAWPFSVYNQWRHPPVLPPASRDGVSFDATTPRPRLIAYPGKTRVACPKQTPSTIVLLLIGQSNAANHAGQRYASEHGDRVIHYFDNSCYEAASPLLGASGQAGESWTLLGNKLVSAGVADRVILIPAAIGDSRIASWAQGGPLNTMLMQVIGQAKAQYRITHVLWQQGESDFGAGTASSAYTESFASLASTLRGGGVDAPIHASVASRCVANIDWQADNPVARAQKALPNKTMGISGGVDTDTLMTVIDRYDDCHFSGTGQEKFANAWFKALRP